MNYYAALQNLSLDGHPPCSSAASPGAEAVGAVAAAQCSRKDSVDCHIVEQAQLSSSPQLTMNGPEAAVAAPTLIRNALIWVDLEMTGLDLQRDTIIEIAIILTDSHLQCELLGPELVIHQPEGVLDGMNDWCREHHGNSGLTDRVRASTTSMQLMSSLDTQEAEEAVLDFVRRYTDTTTRHHLAGSSVHVDLAFLRQHMPRLAEHLPYRVVDVSTVMELCRRWYPQKHAKVPRKRNAHTALSDIQDSIRQLRWYKSNIFRPIQPLPTT